MGGALEAARRRRAELRESIDTLERSLASPAPGRTDAWTDGVRTSLRALDADFHAHVEVTEGPEGLYDVVLATAPRLAHAVAKLKDEHGEIRAYLDDLRACADRTVDEPGVVQVRELGTVLMGLLARHRQRGADLVYEAYSSDIGGET
jgi:hypothetical protein